MQHRPGLMIAIMPHAGEPDGDEDHLDREGGEHGGRGDQEGFGNTSAHTRTANLIQALHREGPVAARHIKLYATALIHLADAFMDHDHHGLEEAADEAVDGLHELIQMTRNNPRQR